MRWNLRSVAIDRGIATSTQMRRRLAEAGMKIGEGKMSALWARAPIMVRLNELDIICAVLDCTPDELLIPEPELIAADNRQQSFDL